MAHEIYSTMISGPLTLHAWEPTSVRQGWRMVFWANSDGEKWSRGVAKLWADAALKAGHNVRIENAGGEIVFDVHRGVVKFPRDVDAFWRECGQ